MNGLLAGNAALDQSGNPFDLNSYNAMLQQRISGVGDRVFKSFNWNSDGIGNTMLDFMKGRPDLFQGIQIPTERTRTQLASDNPEAGGGPMVNSYGAADDILKNYSVQRRGEAGMRDGRRDVVVDSRTGEIVYAGENPYSYDPAKTNLKDAATFIGGALGGYFGVNALSGLGAGSAGAGSAGAGSIDAAFADLMAQGGTLMPEGAGTLLSNSAAALDPTLLAGGASAAGGAAGAAAGSAASGVGGSAGASGGLLSNLGSLGGIAKAALPIAGAIAGSKSQGGQVTGSKTDPRLDPFLYGDQGLLKSLGQWFQQNKSGVNPAMQQGWDAQMGLLSDPTIQNQMTQMRTGAMGLMGNPIAGNGFAKFYGG